MPAARTTRQPDHTVRPQERRATLKGVAAHAGVSISTASLVFSGNGPVSDQTRQKVQAAAEELGYLGPDPVAANLRRGRSGVVGLAVDVSLQHALHDPYALTVVNGLAEVLDDIPVGLLLLTQSPDAPGDLAARLRTLAVDGLVFLGGGAHDNPAADHLAERGIPTIGLGGPARPGMVRVQIDELAAMRSLAEHLRDLGHRRVAVLSLPLYPQDHSAPREVLSAAEALRDAEYSIPADRLLAVREVFGPDVPTAVPTGISVEDGVRAVAALLDLPADRRPTAVLAASDLLALGVIQAATDRGLRVPEDLSVTGFDGIDVDWWPGTLTGVVQPGAEKGRAAGELVRALLEGREVDDVTLPTELRLGDSTAPPHHR